ncbi:MAG: TolC family outer membrane protein [Steroidobacteraceae bacterium]
MMKLWIAAAIASLAVAGIARSEDLATVYQNALESDPLIREADANRLAAREARPQAWANLLPQINGTLQASRNPSESTQPDFQVQPDGSVVIVPIPTEGETDSDGYTLQLRQNVFSWTNWVTLRRASREVAQAEADFQTATQDLVLRVAQRYFDVLAERDNLDAQQASLDATSRQLEQAEKRFEVGLIAITDVQEAKAARDTGAAAVIATKRSLATAEELLREVTGQKYSQLAKPREDMPLKTPDPEDAERWVEVSMNQNLALLSSRLAADIARDNVGIARGGHFPTIGLTAVRNDVDNDVDTTTFVSGPGGALTPQTNLFKTERTDDSIELQLTMPIFSGGLTTSQTRQSRFRWIAARERLQRVSRETERLARDSYLGVISEIARVQALRQAQESSQTALKATEAGYEVGTRTAVDVLDARRTLVQAQTNYARSRYDYLLNVFRLRQAAGNLDGATVSEINAWLAETAPPAPKQ